MGQCLSVLRDGSGQLRGLCACEWVCECVIVWVCVHKCVSGTRQRATAVCLYFFLLPIQTHTNTLSHLPPTTHAHTHSHTHSHIHTLQSRTSSTTQAKVGMDKQQWNLRSWPFGYSPGCDLNKDCVVSGVSLNGLSFILHCVHLTMSKLCVWLILRCCLVCTHQITFSCVSLYWLTMAGLINVIRCDCILLNSFCIFSNVNKVFWVLWSEWCSK